MLLKRHNKGLTLAELLVALVITAIVLTAVATLSFALGTASASSSDTADKQAQLRYATLRISELLRHSRLVCGTAGNDLVLWRADDNGDENINPAELVYLEAGEGRDCLRLLEFSPDAGWPVPLSSILAGSAKDELLLICDYRRTDLLPACSNVGFAAEPSPPRSKFITVSFNIVESGAVRRYQISAALRCWAGHLLDTSGDAIVTDDD
jgi:prepilin-type N-terminal cleavage/methylation domain-containing protein